MARISVDTTEVEGGRWTFRPKGQILGGTWIGTVENYLGAYLSRVLGTIDGKELTLTKDHLGAKVWWGDKCIAVLAFGRTVEDVVAMAQTTLARGAHNG